MKIKKLTIVLFISIFLAVTAIVATFYIGKKILLNKFELFLTNTIESSAGLGIKIGKLRIVHLGRIHLADVALYKSNLYEKKLFSASRIHVKFPIRTLLIKKTFSPTLAIYDLKKGAATLNGSLGLKMKTTKPDATPEDMLASLEGIWFRNLSLKSVFLNIENINGSIEATPDSIKSPGINFTLNGEPCELRFEITEPLGELSSEWTLSSPRINIISTIKKEKETYKIPRIKGKFLNSSFGFMGEFETIAPPVLSLYGKANVNIKDAAFFAPPDLKGLIEYLKPEGTVENSIYFKGDIQKPLEWEAGIKSNAESIKVWNIDLTGLRMDTRIKGGVVNVPLFSAYLYGGVMNSQIVLDLKEEDIPYRINCKLSDISVRKVIENTGLKNKNIRGSLFSEVSIHGPAKNIDLAEGAGRLFVRNANLGPMPLLTPLVGNLYGFFQSALPGLQGINITDVTCDFYIGGRRIATQNLLLMGDLITVRAKGYVDFDKNLNFDVENQIKALETGGDDDWQAALQQMMVQFGRLVSKARLTGTLQKPKWKFERMGGVQNLIKGGLENGLKKLFKGIFE